ncbi:Neuropeptide Y receptor type 1 [Eumeta japonica]|uniref:Neuropeptide Y receptor type 1 n=1 Tax=Eumeta variegata TaxID=151549 RepID=A0A4C1UJL8_EUMVA|nr:Neuropeptide Y receptor type 1 [Eumeta japonica]
MISIASALAPPPSPRGSPPAGAYAVLPKNASQGRDFDISTQKYLSFPQALDRRISANESVDFVMPNDNYTEYAEIPHYIKATSMAFCIVIMCLGVIGNVMVPIVILKTKDMRNSTNIFLVNLSIADLMVLLVCTPTVLVEVNSKPETWVLGKELCKYYISFCIIPRA